VGWKVPNQQGSYNVDTGGRRGAEVRRHIILDEVTRDDLAGDRCADVVQCSSAET
jgi:hypothetical protein